MTKGIGVFQAGFWRSGAGTGSSGPWRCRAFIPHQEMGPDAGTISYLSRHVERARAGFHAGVWAQLAYDDLLSADDLSLGRRSKAADGLANNACYTRPVPMRAMTVRFSANYGLSEVDLASNETERDIGATCFVVDVTGIDLRHCNGTEYPGSYPGWSLTWDTTLLGG